MKLGIGGSRCIALLALALCGAAELVPVDWKALESAVAGYIATPSDATAKTVTLLLPEAGRADLRESAIENETRARIFKQLGKLEPLVASGAPQAAGVALALRAISDGEFTHMLDEALAASLSAHAPDVLAALLAHPEVLGRGCRFAGYTEAGAPIIAAVAELDRRRSAVTAASDADLRRPRACVLLELERAIDAF